MTIEQIMGKDEERPLDRYYPANGGFCGIFRTVGCIGDSLASGEFESMDEEGNKGYHDYFEYSWGQYIAREAGCKVYNFSRGGMTAKEYCDSFASINDFWSPEKRCQAYIIALGVNDTNVLGSDLGSIEDIDRDDWRKNKDTFVGNYARIIQRMKENQPKAKFFLVTIPKRMDFPEEHPDGQVEEHEKARNRAEELHRELIYKIAEFFDNTYVIDLRKEAPFQDKEYKKLFMLGGHRNPCGYMVMARMLMTYINYLIRHNMDDFKQVPFIGKDFHNVSEKW